MQLCGTRNTAAHVLGLCCLPQRGRSAYAGTKVLDRRVEGFVVNFLAHNLRTMSDQEFNSRTEELAVAKLEALTTIAQVATR